MTENKKALPGDAPDPNERANREEKLDKAVADSMDASDPPAIVTKGEPKAPKFHGQVGEKKGKAGIG